MRVTGALFAGLLVLSLALCGCTGASPEVLHCDARLFLLSDPGTESVTESLRLFVSVQDPEGIDDVTVIHVVHDEAEVAWSIDQSGWVVTDYGSDDWIGVIDIRMPGGEPLPRGTYRVVVEDAALQQSENRFSLTAKSAVQTTLPALTGSGASLAVTGETDVVIRVYTRGGQMILSQSVRPGRLPDSVIDRLGEESGLQAYLITDAIDGISLLCGPFSLQ